MSLYGDLPQSKTGSTDPSTGWAGINKFQPMMRKPSTAMAPPAALKGGPGRGAGRGIPITGRSGGRGPPPAAHVQPELLEPAAQAPQPSPAAASGYSLFAGVGPIKDEYDPMHPNDYEVEVQKREEARRQAELEAERQERLREMEEEFERRKQREEEQARSSASRADGDGDERESLHISGEEAYLRRARLSGMPPPGQASSSGGADDDNGEAKGMTLAQKLLMKMGWREGEGLGKNRQGMSTPLVMQKTDRLTGVIVNAEEKRSTADMGPPEKKQRTGAALVGKPSRVICLRNMVGPGEVDEQLEEEVGNELEKYGEVRDVMIFEVITPGFAPEEAVRIFVQFDRVESATKAMVDLQGRYFGGRNVRVAFFAEDRFTAKDLAPAPGEFDS